MQQNEEFHRKKHEEVSGLGYQVVRCIEYAAPRLLAPRMAASVRTVFLITAGSCNEANNCEATLSSTIYRSP